MWRDASIDIGTRTAILLAWNGLLRVSEYTADSEWQALPQFTLMSQDIVPYVAGTQRGYKIRLKRSKADRYNAGSWHFFPEQPGDELCPVQALNRYWRECPDANRPNLPAFTRRGVRSPRMRYRVSRDDISDALKRTATSIGLDPTFISSHSLRIGGAFHLADAGLAMSAIQLRGRWSQRGANEVALMYTRLSTIRAQAIADAFSTPGGTFLGGRLQLGA